MTADRQGQETGNDQEQVNQGSPQRDGGNATERNVEQNHRTVQRKKMQRRMRFMIY